MKCDEYISMVHQKDKEIAELKAENERLNNALDKERGETIKYMDELCNAKNEIERLTIDKRNAELRADVADATVEKLKAENAVLKQKQEDVQASAYAESVDAGMRERKLKMALWLARAERAHLKVLEYWPDYCHNAHCRIAEQKWDKVELKCRAMAEKFGG